MYGKLCNLKWFFLWINRRNYWKPTSRWDITGNYMMKKKIILLLLPILLFVGCASNKLNRTVWYNVTMMQGNGVMGNVGTSLVFNTDSTVVVYKGVSVDTNVVVSPYIYAYGKYQYNKIDKRNTHISLSATTRDGSPYKYTGEYNKKNGLMILNVPNSKMKVTFIWNPDAKLYVK